MKYRNHQLVELCTIPKKTHFCRVYISSEVLENDQQFIDLLDVTSKQAKKDLHITTSGKVIIYEFDGKTYPATPQTAFYNFCIFQY